MEDCREKKHDKKEKGHGGGGSFDRNDRIGVKKKFKRSVKFGITRTWINVRLNEVRKVLLTILRWNIQRDRTHIFLETKKGR